MSTSTQFSIVIPCFNENQTIIRFLDQLCAEIENLPHAFNVVVVNDSSLDITLDLLQEYSINSDHIKLHLLNLHYNVGHQKAIQQGLLYCREINTDFAIVMDGDGEDDPAAIGDLVTKTEFDYVPVVRKKRKESPFFKLGYNVYKLLFKVVIGSDMNFGNYCLMSRKMIINICDNGFIHLAGFLSRQRCKKSQVFRDRAKRLDGQSKMNFSSLVHHGFRSFVEYSEDFLMFFLKLFMLVSIGAGVLISNVLYKKLISFNAIPGWASTLSISLFTAALICFGFFATGVILINMMQKASNHAPRKIFDILKGSHE